MHVLFSLAKNKGTFIDFIGYTCNIYILNTHESSWNLTKIPGIWTKSSWNLTKIPGIWTKKFLEFLELGSWKPARTLVSLLALCRVVWGQTVVSVLFTLNANK